MIKGAYSDKYKSIQNEHLEKLKDHVKAETQNVRDRAKQLSRETNRRRKNLEEKKKQRAQDLEKERAAALAERHKKKEEATQKFQKDANKRKSGSGSAGRQTTDPHTTVQVGSRGVENQNGDLLIPAVPALEDALELVNNPEAFDKYMQYRSQLLASNVEYGTHNASYIPYGYTGDLSIAQNVGYTPMMGSTAVHYTNGVVNNNDYDDVFRMDGEPNRLEQERLRQDAIQNSGPKLAFMNNTQECTDGALLPTMGHESPSGSLTSLDSLDEIPQDATVPSSRLTNMPAQSEPVIGIINKGPKIKSAGRRKVTFSDSIEFDDGLTGQLVTIEKESCKNYVNMYNSRIAANNMYNAEYASSAVSNARSSTSIVTPAAQAASQALSGIQGQAMTASPKPVSRKTNPGSGIPVKKPDINSITSPSPGSSTSMVMPMSVYSQIKSQGRQPVATVGESTSSEVTYTGHPSQIQSQGRTVATVGESTSSGVTYTGDPSRIQSQGRTVATVGESTSSGVTYTGDPSQRSPGRQPVATVGEFTRRIATVGESTSSAVTYTDHPSQNAATNRTSGSQFHRKTQEDENSVNNGNEELRTRTRGSHPDEDSSPDLMDSLDVAADSLEEDERGNVDDKVIKNSGVEVKQSNAEDPTWNRNPPETTNVSDSPQSIENDDTDSGVDYYGKPETIYHHPFGGKITTEGHQSQAYVMPTTQHNGSGVDPYFGDKASMKSVSDKSRKFEVTTKPDETSKIKETREDEDSHVNSQNSAPTFEGVNLSGLAPPNLESHSVPTQPSYYRSWYSGSFFPNRKDNTTSLQDGQIVSPGKASNKGRNSKEAGVERPQGNTPVQKDEKNNGSNANIVAKPPGPRERSLAYHSILQKKRAAAAVKHERSRQTSLNSKARKPVNHQNSVSGQKSHTREGYCASPMQIAQKNDGTDYDDDDDEFMKNIKRNVEARSLQGTASPAHEEYNKHMMDSMPYRPKVNTRLETPDLQLNGQDYYDDQFETHQESFGTSKKVHPPRLGSARGRGRQVTSNTGPMPQSPSNMVPQGKPPIHGGPHSPGKVGPSKPNAYQDQNTAQSYKHGTGYYGDNIGAYNTQGWTNTSTAYNHLPSREGQGQVNPHMTNIKQSIRLDKTPTDDEINVLWDRVRLCLDQNETPSVGSDSCVDRVDVRRSRTTPGPYNHHRYSGVASKEGGMHSSATPGVGMGTIGGLRRYGSYEVLRHGSADNLGHRKPLLQHRAHRTRTSSLQGKPPMVPRQQYPSPASSRQGPSPTMSSRAGGPQPLSQTELRAVLQASERTQGTPSRDHKTEHAQLIQYQALMGSRRGPSALSIEEQRLMQSLDRLNERLQAQETKLNQAALTKEHRTPSVQSRPVSKQRTPSALYKKR